VVKQANNPKLREWNVEQTLLAEDVVVRYSRTGWTDAPLEQGVQSTLSGKYTVIRSKNLQVN